MTGLLGERDGEEKETIEEKENKEKWRKEIKRREPTKMKAATSRKIKTGRGKEAEFLAHSKVSKKYGEKTVFTWRSQPAVHLGKGFQSKRTYAKTYLSSDYFN